ncbi:hypothetical protein [Rhodobacter lacus]|uniref:Lipoprotein n=1 Tax=Rhodobacter lacus TaxID=1641972 RepID=A0ABW5ADN2_9RHOB
MPIYISTPNSIKHMMKAANTAPALLISAAIVLSGCEFSVPVTGMIGKEPAQGSATAKTSGIGTFEASTIDGLTCKGTYDSLTQTPTIWADVTCNDGRTGRLLITRSMDQLSGTATGKLSDGSMGRFVFGNLAFDQAFGSGSATTR